MKNKDQEFLEFSAKACGFETWDFMAWPGFMNVYCKDGRHEAWNPLEDDGDALRLAAKLDFDIRIDSDLITIIAYQLADGWISETPYDGDKLAAIRRAIVRAASEVGQNMP